jgi:O-acetyl-ADP-ribose deacetylase (regulator of RNase III)
MQKRIGKPTLELVQGDITASQVDAIVNAANIHLQHGGGVAWAIVRKGGHAIQEESDAIIAGRGPLETGEAVITSGGKLPAKFVIHTAGPVWGEGGEDNKLRKSIRSSLELADKRGIATIAFPAISTGIYRFPVDRAAKLMLDEAAKYLRGKTSVERVLFCLYDDATYRAFEQAFQELK